MIYTRENFVDDIVTTTYLGYAFNVDWEAGIFEDISAPTIYLRFVSHDTIHYTGFNVTFIAASRRGR